jgi:NAD(P)-dependent dehydrogenase (short-subunit alcohol dehydrogenase family)
LVRFRGMPRPSFCRQAATLGQRLAGKLVILAMDVTALENIRSAAAQVGDVAIDLIINCVGITGASGQEVGKVDYDSWAEVLDVNTMGPLRVIETFLDRIVRSQRRLAITITSGMSSLGDNTSGGSIAYRSSKAHARSTWLAGFVAYAQSAPDGNRPTLRRAVLL